jgi:hypothetical protein
MILARRIEHAFDVPVQCPHDADAPIRWRRYPLHRCPPTGRPTSGLRRLSKVPSALCVMRPVHDSITDKKMGRPALERGGPARPHGVIRFQHRRKINCGSYSEHTCAHSRPHDSRKLLVIEGLELLKTRSCYEYHPPGLSKKVRTAMGRQIFAADADHASTSV